MDCIKWNIPLPGRKKQIASNPIPISLLELLSQSKKKLTQADSISNPGHQREMPRKEDLNVPQEKTVSLKIIKKATYINQFY